MITFRPSYPGSPVEHAYLGAVIVGGVHADGKRGAWYSALPLHNGGVALPYWNRTKNVDVARAELTDQVASWCEAARVEAMPATLARIRAALELHRRTFCLAMPGSDEEIAAYVEALDFAIEVIRQGQEPAVNAEVAP